MNRMSIDNRDLPKRSSRASDLPRRGFLALFASLLTGCTNAWLFTTSGKARTSTEEELTGTQLVGDVAKIWGGDTQRVTSICLVTNLRGTGGEPAAGSDRRKMLIDIMKKNRVDDITGLLASKCVSDAVVIGEIPPAAQKGDRFDVLVETPNGAETSSLRHGWLLPTDLKQAKSLGGRTVQGHTEAIAEGPIVVDAEFDSVPKQSDPTAQAKINPREVKGKIVGGGVVMRSRIFGLVIFQKTTISQPVVIQNSINRRFNFMDRGAKGGVANAKDDDFIELRLDPQYRGNLDHYFRVISHVAVGESDEARTRRLVKLRTMLMEPTSSMSAALQLEAIGPRGIETLLEGLESKDLQVRFLSAQALAYQDKQQSVPVLREAAETESAFRWQALAALSTLTHVSALDALDALLHVSSAQTRYGAFRAIKKRADRNLVFGAEKLGEHGQFTLHTVPSNAPPMVHYTRSREPEIVLFGDAIEMRIPEFMDGGKEIIVKASEDGEQIKICRYAPGKEDLKVQCAPRVKDFIHALAEVGASYSLIVQLLDQAKRDDLLGARLVADATPRQSRDYEAIDDSGEEVAAPPPTSLMELPDMFQTRQSTRIRPNPDDEDAEDTKDVDSPWYTRIGGWFGFEK